MHFDVSDVGICKHVLIILRISFNVVSKTKIKNDRTICLPVWLTVIKVTNKEKTLLKYYKSVINIKMFFFLAKLRQQIMHWELGYLL